MAWGTDGSCFLLMEIQLFQLYLTVQNGWAAFASLSKISCPMSVSLVLDILLWFTGLPGDFDANIFTLSWLTMALWQLWKSGSVSLPKVVLTVLTPVHFCVGPRVSGSISPHEFGENWHLSHTEPSHPRTWSSSPFTATFHFPQQRFSDLTIESMIAFSAFAA